MNSIVDYSQRINRLITGVANDLDTHDEMKKAIKYVLENPGKMVRSRLMLLISEKCSDNKMDELLSYAAAIEMIHTSSLILDDMIDKAPLRRGKPTIAAMYGDPIAVCSGDYLLITAIRFLLDRGYHDKVSEIINIVQNVCSGEMLQHLHSSNVDVSEKDYLAAIAGKTAYAFRGSCRLSALITWKDEQSIPLAERFGDCIGIIFQLRDDLLDWTMSEEKIGKPVNLDFSEGVYTLPAIYTFRQEHYGDRLRELAAKECPSGSNFDEIRQLVKDSGGIDYTVNYIKKLTLEALELLDQLPDILGKDELRKVLKENA